jgi:hypothetical protein
VCDRTIEAKGCVVPDENFRTGRRAQKMHGVGGSQVGARKTTHLLNLPVHPALEGAYEDFLKTISLSSFLPKYERPQERVADLFAVQLLTCQPLALIPVKDENPKSGGSFRIEKWLQHAPLGLPGAYRSKQNGLFMGFPGTFTSSKSRQK